MKVKQNVVFFLLGALLMLPFGGYAATLVAQAVDVPIYVDGQRIDTTVYAIEDRNYTSVRDVAEAMGGIVEWKNKAVWIETPKVEPTDIEKVVETCKDSCVMIYVYKNGTLVGQGSGFAYNGYIITAKHITDAGDKFAIYQDDLFYGLYALPVELDTILDVSALVFDVALKPNIPSVTLGDSDTLKEGQKLIAITSPAGVKNAVDECFYHGMTYTDDKEHIGISDSNIEGGSSGGAIFNTDGELIGIVTRGVKGNGAAIPVNKIKPILEKLK